MAQQNKTGLYVGIAAVVAVIVIVAGVLIANNNKGGDTGGENGGTNVSSNTPNYNSIDTTIEYGDFEGMTTLSKSIQNGESTGKIVKVDGIVSHPISSYSIVQENEAGSQKIGTKFIIEGMDEADYPQDGEHVIITGEVFEESPMMFVIKTYPEYVKTAE